MENYNSEDRRIFERFPAKISVTYCDINCAREERAQTYDICAKGLCLVTNDFIEEESPVDIWVHIADHKEALHVRGTVVWSKLVMYNKYRTGIALPEADLMGISRILRT